MELTPKANGTDKEFDVTGISRSGRIRKKSYKLIDFEPDNSPAKQRKPCKIAGKVGRGRPRKQIPISAKESKSEEDTIPSDDGVEYESESSEYASEDEYDNQVYKANKKEKKKHNFEAYLLWSKDVKKQILAQEPDIEFPVLSKKLGDIWSTLSKNEKLQWKKRVKQKQSNHIERFNTNQVQPKIINPTIGKIRIKKEAEETPKTIVPNKNNMEQVSETHHIAAHFRLLGENLAIIGERLREHEGQIAISGGLSVLLDSLICSIGPLMCLTTQLPGVADNLDLKINLGNILDNIAYVMPGL